MTLIKWKPSFSLGIPSVDHEHRELIGAINTVYDSMIDNADPEIIESCLEYLCGRFFAFCTRRAPYARCRLRGIRSAQGTARRSA